jgi:hypothetical protein
MAATGSPLSPSFQRLRPVPTRPELAPIRHDVDGPGAALRADEPPAPRDRRELQFVGQAKHGEGERCRTSARGIRAGHEQAFEAVGFEVRDRGRCRRYGKIILSSGGTENMGKDHCKVRTA